MTACMHYPTRFTPGSAPLLLFCFFLFLSRSHGIHPGACSNTDLIAGTLTHSLTHLLAGSVGRSGMYPMYLDGYMGAWLRERPGRWVDAWVSG
ncbi:hypothetical protein IWZ03DRAFT_382711 [Phyllosticta citriasiana]|uniref:Secreted protein n=1 Tax=Phyllosticta citriasiana TaxID=595635 RepID=A0ABR1KK79_9PEZI